MDEKIAIQTHIKKNEPEDDDEEIEAFLAKQREKWKRQGHGTTKLTEIKETVLESRTTFLDQTGTTGNY
jgi:hypothetical protein